MDCVRQHACYGGTLAYYEHQSEQAGTKMRFSLFTPPSPTGKMVMFLSGLTCTEDNFTTKAGAYGKAAELGLHILAPDTSPRGEDVANDDAYDLGQGAGFYLDATQAPWAKHFRMESYLMQELLPQVQAAHTISATSITGHSMGGHGALTLYFRHAGSFASCSAFAPIVAPTRVPWGKKAFTAYLGEDTEAWKQHDATHLVSHAAEAKSNAPILIDQGLADDFYKEQLQPELFEAACQRVGQNLELRLHEGYDHSYFFIQSFIADHLEHHARYLD